MHAFRRVVETGSFSAAAREQNVSQPKISKLIAALETQLGAPLLRRTSRSLSLTEAGQTYLETARRVLADVEEAEARIGAGEASASGLLRIAVPLAIGRLHLLPIIADFARLHPALKVDVQASQRFVDLIEEGLDVAVRIGPLPDSGLIARRIGDSRRRTVASPGYIGRHGRPDHPDDLKAHSCIGFSSSSGLADWRFARGARELAVAPQGWLRTNDAEQIRAAMIAGMGVAQAPGWLFSDLIASGAAQAVLEDWRPPAEPIHAVYPVRRPATKVRLLVEFLAQRLAGLDEG